MPDEYISMQSGDGRALQKRKDEPITVATKMKGMVSIIIPCCGMLEYTKLCVPSVLRFSRPPYELIFLDIGSLDGTSEYLAGVQTGLAATTDLRVEIVRAETDLGIRDACRTALKQAGGEYVVLLNNDTVVTEGWLNQLIGLSSMSPAVGMVGPMSNYAAPPQLIETVPYRIGPRKSLTALSMSERGQALVDIEAVNAFAHQRRKEYDGKWLSAERLGGFCLLIKRQVLDKIGSDLDKWSDLGLFDTDILSAKVRQVGYTLACCRDLFVHHFGSRIFAHGAPDKKEDKPVQQ